MIRFHENDNQSKYLYRLLIICFFSIFGLIQMQAHPGIGIVLDSKGNVYYTDLAHVWKISPDGNRSIVVKDVHTHELYMDEYDNLYGEHEWYNGEAADTWGNYVWCLSQEGVREIVIPEVEGFLDNNTLIRDSNGNSYWVKKHDDYQILNKQNPSGTSTVFATHRFTDIRWMHFSRSDKNLYVVDRLQIKKVSPSGIVSVIADDLKENQPLIGRVADRHYIFGIWSDTKKNIYVAVYGAGKVKRISANREIKTIFKSESFWSPCGGIIASDGTQWILEFSRRNRTRVRKISTDGKHTLFGG